MRFLDFITEAKPDPKASASRAQAVWAEKDFAKKKALAAEFINKMAYKDKKETNLRKLSGMSHPAKVDKFIADIQLKGEGSGVV